MSNDHGGQIPDFHGDVARFRDWKRAVLVYHAGAEENKRLLTGPRILNALKGEAKAAVKDFDSEALRTEGAAGLARLMLFLEESFGWQPESILFEAMESFLIFPARGHQ